MSFFEKFALVVWMSGACFVFLLFLSWRTCFSILLGRLLKLLPRSWQGQPPPASVGGLGWPPAEGNVRCFHLQQQRQCWTNCSHLRGRHRETFICSVWIRSCHLGPVSQAAFLESPRLPRKRGNSGVSRFTEWGTITPEKWEWLSLRVFWSCCIVCLMSFEVKGTCTLHLQCTYSCDYRDFGNKIWNLPKCWTVPLIQQFVYFWIYIYSYY